MKSEEAKLVDEKIEAIGEVNLESNGKILDAQKAVDALSEEDKAQLDNLDDLEEAKKKYDELVAKKAADEVSEKIKKIGEVTADNLTLVAEADEAYNNLSKQAKEYVKNYNVLKAAKEKAEPLKEEKINSILSTMHLEEDRVRNMRFYNPSAFKYYSNGSWAADIRCFMLPYLGMDNDSCWMRLIYNYTGDDWVFFKSVLMSVDGKQYTRTFKYFDIVHDNGGGDVWEYIDVETTDSDIKLLKEIANSNETIIRFQGDDYSFDYTIPASDKLAIKDVITVYELKQ
jgi:hypothetical protein